ncbi:Cytochrome c biogenesis protein CcdA [Raineyella antarctica]|uniref:Cytochrome c biogenesis protein CcdA n=1 Tax=Raineyella antarctica TaxID=1577474 RepID=A0A1G6GEM8_9ACTN|nr:cytochrome c biogenesis CcdA family protein [Raineyella antarctica]SDB80461.1 Cytochrome c biogenesis protein CcdA [Raineyella antarctica]
MGDLLTTGSVLAAFFAGGVALFAPCCIVFLAPSYLAAAVKNRRWRLLPLTFVFTAGLALVMLPLTLGMSLLSGAIAHYHRVLYYGGGALMVLLAVWSLTGRMWSLPSILRAPDTRRGDSASFFSLGVFSGVASACCAPVLAGVMTLSALSASPVGGVALGLAYVFGMAFPLFVMALLWDRLRLGERRFLRAHPVVIRLGGRSLHTNVVNVAVAVAFALMGGFVIHLANSGTMTTGPGFQVAIGEAVAGVFRRLETWSRPVPEAILGVGLIALVAAFVVATLKDRHSAPGPHTAQPASPDEGNDQAPYEGADQAPDEAVDRAPGEAAGEPATTKHPSCH